MKKQKVGIYSFKNGILRSAKLMFVACIVLVFYLVFITCYQSATFHYKGNILYVLLYTFLLSAFLFTYGSLRDDISTLQGLLFSFSLSVFITDFISYFTICLFARAMLEIYPVLFALFVQIALAIPYYWFIQLLYRKLNPPKHAIALIMNCDYEMRMIRKFDRKNSLTVIDEIVCDPKQIENIYYKIDQYSVIVIGHLQLAMREAILLYAFQQKKKVILLPSPHDVLFNSATPIFLDDSLIYNFRNHCFSADQLAIKRLTDVFISIILLLLSLPLWLITSIAIKLTDGGPVFYKQERLTRNRNLFELIKFRSMIVDAEKETGAVQAKKDDERITKVGKLIRMTRIDELPQLLNIIKGDMSLVGPRPERPEIYEKICKRFPEFSMRLNVKAGLTGYAQIRGRYNTSYEDKIKMDLYYIENANWLMDIRLLLNTIKILFLPESTEGFSAGQTTAMTQDIVDYDKVDIIYSDGEENEEKTVQNS